MSPQLSIAIKVTGPKVDAREIEHLVGFNGSAEWRKGDLVEGTKIQRKEDGWEYRAPFQPGYAIEQKIDELRKKLGEQGMALRKLCQEQGYRIGVVCVAEMYDETAGLALGPDLVGWIADLGASLDIDTYVCEPDGKSVEA